FVARSIAPHLLGLKDTDARQNAHDTGVWRRKVHAKHGFGETQPPDTASRLSACVQELPNPLDVRRFRAILGFC
ncbi:MAG TPA: hypothetical protein PLP66_05365, partial [Phycisphaerae bacterium]|nr:hypothetical protein [Phycisphaerae bacterium]